MFSGRELLDLDSARPVDETRIITLDMPQGRFGVSVDGVDGIVYFPENEIDTSQRLTGSVIQGTHQRGDQLLIVTDFAPFFENVALPS